jgi:hypothetical protein
MTSWLDFLLDSTPIRKIYGGDIPNLEGIDFHEIVLNRDGPRVLLRFDFQQFPVNPPKKWKLAGYNRLQLRLLAVGIHEISLIGLTSECKLNLDITNSDGLIRIQTQEGDMKINILADSLLVDHISAYRDQKD